MELNQRAVKVELDEERSDGLDRELERYRSKWKELEEKGEKLLVEIRRGISDIELAASKFISIQKEKLGIENGVKVLMQVNLELEKKITDLGKQKGAKFVADLSDDEEDRVTQLVIENNVLECEKRTAESLAEDLKLTCWRLEMENSALREGILISDKKFSAHCKGIGNSQEADAPLSNISTAETERVFSLKSASRNSHKVRKQLTFGEEVSTFTKIAPSTPGIGRPYPCGVVDINDSEEDQKHNANDLKYSISNYPRASMLKRRTSSNIIDSDYESDDEDDDNVPICKLRRKQLKREPKNDLNDFDLNDGVKESLPPRRRLMKKYSTFTKMAPSTPGIGRPYPCGVVDIIDSEDDQKHNPNDLKYGISNYPRASMLKRRTSNIINSDYESDDEDDDNVPICKLKSKQLKREPKKDLNDFDLNDGVKESSPPRRRLMKKYNKKIPEKASPNDSYEILKDEELEDDEDETGFSTESETLGGFIVNGSDISENDVSLSVPEEISDDEVDYNEVISNIRRKKEMKLKWEFEADMLADFATNIELCMKAVCALYRKQTEEEKCSKQTILLNGIGFSQFDAPRGTILAEFLCDGEGNVCKTMEELREYNAEGPQLCRTLATRYSRQLFEIYKKKEDPLFLPD